MEEHINMNTTKMQNWENFLGKCFKLTFKFADFFMKKYFNKNFKQNETNLT